MTIEGPAADQPYWTVKDAAHYARLSAQTVYDACNKLASDLRHLDHVRIGAGRSIRTRREWVDEWMQRAAHRRPQPKQGKLWDSSSDAHASIRRIACTNGA